MEKVKVGVIGVGHLGSIHLKIWKTNAEIEFVGIYDADVLRAKELAKQYETQAFETLDALVERCDCVTIAVPTSLHYEVAMKCINAGLHCFIEKPVTAHYSEALELIRAAEKKNVLLQVGHVERFNPALTALHSYKLEPLFAEVHRLARFTPRATDVSVILDLMIHDIDIVLWLIKSEVKSIEANGVAILTDSPDIANARLTFENGAVANLTSSRMSAHPMRKLRIFQRDAYFSIDFANQDVEVYKIYENSHPSPSSIPAQMLGTIEAGLKNRNIYFEHPAVPQVNAIENEQKSFISAIKGISPITVTGRAGAEALRVAEEINTTVLKNIVGTL